MAKLLKWMLSAVWFLAALVFVWCAIITAGIWMLRFTIYVLHLLGALN